MRFLVAAVWLASACSSAPPARQPEVPEVPEVDDLDVDQDEPAPPPRASAPPPAPVARPAPPPRRSDRTIFRGRRIDLDVRNADLDNLFRFLATVGGINIVVAPDVRGSVTLRVRQVPWDQIAHVVARANGLVIDKDGSVWLIRKRTP